MKLPRRHSCIWQRALLRYWPCRAALRDKPILPAQSTSSLAMHPQVGPTSSRDRWAKPCASGSGNPLLSRTDRAPPVISRPRLSCAPADGYTTNQNRCGPLLQAAREPYALGGRQLSVPRSDSHQDETH
jgi:hypothetical protein